MQTLDNSALIVFINYLFNKLQCFANSDFNKLRYDYSFLKSEYEHEQVCFIISYYNDNDNEVIMTLFPL